jgi:PAS domain S-box-containing protein
MNLIRELFSSNDFMPHGFCYQWKPLLIWLHGISDSLIAIAYFSIPLALIYLVRKKRNIPFDWMFVCFGTFIAACGATHLMEVVTLWMPVYWISGGVKVITALASLPTAILLTRVVPQVLNLPSPDDLRAANQELGRQATILREQAALLDLSQDAIHAQTIDGKNLLWNQGAERMYGWSKAEAIGQFDHDLLQTNFPRPRNEIIDKLLATGYWDGELQQKRRDGQTIIVSSRWALGRGLDGSARNVLMIDTDITEQRRAEDAMRESEERFRLMADNIEEIFWLLDPKSLAVIYVSPAFEHICERALASIYSNPTSYREIIHSEDVRGVLAQLALLEQTNEFHEQFRIVCPSGTVKWVEVWGFTAKDSIGNVTALVGTVQDITERKRAEDAHRRSEELLRAAFNQAAVGFSVTNMQGQFVKVNRTYCRITGYSEEELLKMNFQSITDPQDLPANLVRMHRLVVGEISNTVYQKRYIRKSGELVWVQNSVSPLSDGDGKVSGFVALTEDITDRKRAEDALRASEDRYRDLVENSSDLICTHDAQGILLSVNEAPLRILGYSREELLNKPLRDFVTPEARPLCDAYLAQVQRDGFAKGLLPVVAKNGDVRLWEYNNSLRKEGVSSPVVRGIAHDVTEQKRAEAALRRSEEKFSKAFRSSPVEMVITTLEEGRFLDANESFEKNTRFTREEVIGRTSLELGLWVDPQERAAVVEEIKKNGRIMNREIQIRAKSGDIGFKLYSAELIQIAGEQCLLAVSEDITERKRAEERIRKLSGRLLQLQDEERRKIARDLHDATGQDLVALSSTLGRLQATTPSSSRKLRRSISQCQAVADRCIREIRTLSYLLHPPMLDEAGLEDAIRHYVPGYAERTGIEVELEISPGFGRLAQEEEMALFRVMQESLVNIHRHSGSFSARILLDRNTRGILLEVSDKGRGIPGNGQGRNKGLSFAGGVGVQSMQERLKQVGGQLEIESSTNGTTVRAMVSVHD